MVAVETPAPRRRKIAPQKLVVSLTRGEGDPSQVLRGRTEFNIEKRGVLDDGREGFENHMPRAPRTRTLQSVVENRGFRPKRAPGDAPGDAPFTVNY